MSDDHNEAMRLAGELVAPIGTQTSYQTAHEAAALLRKQAADLKSARAETNRIIALLDAANDERKALRAEVERLKPNAERYEWLCEKLGETQLPTLIERITQGYVADYKPSIDAAIDTARKATQ